MLSPQQNKALKILIALVVLVCLGLGIKEIILKPRAPFIAEMLDLTPQIKIDLSLFRESMPVVLPELKVTLQGSATTTPPFSSTTLTAFVSGITEGEYLYRFDCQGDGQYESISAETLETSFSVECFYPAEGLYTSRVLVEEKTQGRQAAGTFDILSAEPNQAPEIIACQVTAVGETGLSQHRFVFSAQVFDADNDDLTYQWDFGDGNSSEEAEPLYQYEKAGFYLPKLTVADSKGAEDTCIPQSLLTLGQFFLFEQLEAPAEFGRDYPFRSYESY